jgi:hypothetical protein
LRRPLYENVAPDKRLQHPRIGSSKRGADPSGQAITPANDWGMTQWNRAAVFKADLDRDNSGQGNQFSAGRKTIENKKEQCKVREKPAA